MPSRWSLPDDRKVSSPALYGGDRREKLKTLRLKLRDGSEWLSEACKETNFVWNYCNEVSAKAASPFCGKPKYLSGFDLNGMLAGASKELDYLPMQSIQQIAEEYAIRRRQFKKAKLRWRKSAGSKRSLGWVPFKVGQVKLKNGALVFAKQRFRVFDSYGLKDYELRSGSFSQDALGNWYVNIAVKTDEHQSELPTGAIGIDLGLKTIATTSNGEELSAGRWTQTYAKKLAQAQRRGHKRQAKRIHAKVANCRKDALHKFSHAMVEQYGAIYIGDVSSKKLAKTKMAKSVLDSGWGMLKTMLQYKGHEAGRIVETVSERFTTQTCSCCGSISGPKGGTGLVVREWTCPDCGAEHLRDVNAARNILARGLSGPSAGTIGGIRHA